jgi:hypothetical protein
LLTEADLPWLNVLCHRKYSARYDEQSTELWFRNTVLKNAILFYPIRTENAFTISMLSVNPWLPGEFECHNIFTCADTGCIWEVVTLFRASIAWATKRKVTWWRLNSETDFDLAPLARRVGAKDLSPRLSLRLRKD